MDNRFENKGKDQNVAQGDGAIGKQVNITQKVTGNNNVLSATGDIHVHLEPAPIIPRQLPYLDACFLGRDKELAELVEQLHPGQVVAVCGPGGMGKTALAAQAVNKLAELKQNRFPDGIVFHSFYHQPSTDMALQTICQAFQVEAEAGLTTAVQTALAGKKALLILDGTEEAEDLKAVLNLRSTCGVLITSRKRSDAQAPPKDIKPLRKQAAAEVFRFHSGATGDDANVQGICTILGGWPVGLRIAGRYLSSTGENAADYLHWLEQEPFKELGDGEHQEENAALLLRRSVAQVSRNASQALSLFGVLAFEPVSRASVASVLDENIRCCRLALNELVTYGLLEKWKDRWQISHALIHAYARTELALSKESLERLAAYYIGFCEKQSKAGLEGYARLDGERAHCLRLIKSCLNNKLWQEVQALVGAISIYLDRQGWRTEQLAVLKMRLTADCQTGDYRGEATCLNNLGYTYQRCGKHDQALKWYTQCLSICRELGHKEDEAAALHNIGWVYEAQGKHDEALQQYQQSLMIWQEIGDRKGEGATLNNISTIYMQQGKHEQALQQYKKSLLIRQEAGDKIGSGQTLNNMAFIYHALGDYAKTLDHLEQALAIRQELGDRASEAVSCWNIGRIYQDQGDLAKAEQYISRVVEIAEAIDHPSLKKWRNGLEQVRAERQGA